MVGELPGNGGKDASTFSPGNHPNVIAVSLFLTVMANVVLKVIQQVVVQMIV